jgi:hypothetical protein
VAKGALAEIFSCAVAVVELVTVTAPNPPAAPVPTAIPGPKMAFVVPFTKCVPVPVMMTEIDWPCSPELATTERIVGMADDAVTVSDVLPITLPLVAVMIVEPAAAPAVARPELLIVAMVVLDDAHSTLAVRFCVELSLNVPVAVNC